MILKKDWRTLLVVSAPAPISIARMSTACSSPIPSFACTYTHTVNSGSEIKVANLPLLAFCQSSLVLRQLWRILPGSETRPNEVKLRGREGTVPATSTAGRYLEAFGGQE